jgi:hypothetical protein
MKTEFMIPFHASTNKAGTLAQMVCREHEAQWCWTQNKKLPTVKKAVAYDLSGLNAWVCQSVGRCVETMAWIASRGWFCTVLFVLRDV